MHLLKSSVPAHALNSWSSFPNGRLNGFSHGIMGVSVPLEQRVYVTFIFSCLFCLAYPALSCSALPYHVIAMTLIYPAIPLILPWIPTLLPFHFTFPSSPYPFQHPSLFLFQCLSAVLVEHLLSLIDSVHSWEVKTALRTCKSLLMLMMMINYFFL